MDNMKTGSLTFILTAAAAGVLFTATSSLATSSTYYDASAKRVSPTSTFGNAYYYNPAIDNGGAPGHILFDDVTVSNTFKQTLFNVTQVTFGISRAANAPAVSITPYFAQLISDAQLNGGAGDGPNFDPALMLPQAQFSTQVNLPANTVANAGSGAFPAATTGGFVNGAEITFGDGTTTLFNVPGSFASPSATNQYKSFALGMRFSTNNSLNGATVGTNANNMDLLYDYTNESQFSEFTFGSDASGLILGTLDIKVKGLVLTGVAGDANNDEKVDVTDLGILATNYNMPGDYTNGDFNFDGFVDVTDLGILATNYNVGVGAMSFQEALNAVGLGGVTVPEPSSMALFGIAAAALKRRHRSV